MVTIFSPYESLKTGSGNAAQQADPLALSSSYGNVSDTSATPENTPAQAPSSTTISSSAQPTSVNVKTTAAKPTSSNLSITPYQDVQTNDYFKNLFKPISTQLQQSKEATNKAAQDFSSGAGSYRDYNTSGAQNTLSGSLGSFANTFDSDRALAEAKGLVNTKYTGPASLGDTSQSQNMLTSLYGKVPSFRTTYGVENLLQQTNPGLSSGQYEQEAAKLLKQPEYQSAASQYGNQIQQALAEYSRAQQQAKMVAEERTTQEADIAKQSRGYLEGRYNEALTPIQQRVTDLTKEEADAKAIYDDAIATNDFSKLEQLPEKYRGGVDVNAFNTPIRQLTNQSYDTYNSIMDKYTDLKDVPTMQLGYNKKGIEQWQLPNDWYKANKDKYSAEQMTYLKDKARARQKELIASGFSPKTSTTAQGTNASNVIPLWGMGPAYQNANLGDYFSFSDAAQRPSVENVSTTDERKLIERINTTLDTLEKNIQNPETAYENGYAAADLEKYLTDENAAFSSQKEGISKASSKWIKTIKSAQKRYAEAKRKAFWGKVTRIVLDVGTFGGYEGMRSLGMDQPEKMGGGVMSSMFGGGPGGMADKGNGSPSAGITPSTINKQQNIGEEQLNRVGAREIPPPVIAPTEIPGYTYSPEQAALEPLLTDPYAYQGTAEEQRKAGLLAMSNDGLYKKKIV